MLADQPNEPVILDLLSERLEHDLMIKLVKAAGDVTFDKPGRSRPIGHHLAQRGVATSVGTVTMGVIGELRLIIRLQEDTHHFAE